MAKRSIQGSGDAKKTPKRAIKQYEHADKQRVNIPPVGLVTPETDPDPIEPARARKTYAYDPHLDPQLTWAGKAERTSFDVPTVSLHVHERIDPKSIIEAVRAKNGTHQEQASLFAQPSENPPLRDAVEFYKHRHNWSTRRSSTRDRSSSIRRADQAGFREGRTFCLDVSPGQVEVRITL